MGRKDPAVLGSCRLGYFRLGVTIPDWDNKVLPPLKNVAAKHMGGIDPFVVGEFRVGYFRVGVYIPLFDAMVERMKKVG